MSDLLGDDFAELVTQRGDVVNLSNKASMYLPMDRGTIFLWPSSLVEASTNDDFKPSVDYISNVINKYRRTVSRPGEPLREFFKQLFVAEHNQCELPSFTFTTRDTLVDTVGKKPILSRLQKELVEYGLLKQIVPNRGPKPAVFQILFPFTPIEPAPIPQKNVATIDLSGYQTLNPTDETDREQQIVELNRQALHKSRPHEITDADGKLIKTFSRTAVVRSPMGGLTTVEITAETFEGSDVAVMTKTDEYIFGILKAWCLSELKTRRKLGKPSDDWYVISPADLAEQLGYADGKNQIGNLREMMERWKDTRVRAEVVDHDGVDENGEFVSYLTQHIITQFADHKSQYKTLPSGKKVLEALAFQLPTHIQKDLERRAAHNGQEESLVQGVAKLLQRTSSRTLMTDSFAIALTNFFWNWASRYYQGWEVELWKGFSEIFDFEFPNPNPDLDSKERKKILDGSRVRFNRLLERFFRTFSDNSDEALKTWKGTTGGVIRFDFPEFVLTITLQPRNGVNQRQKGVVNLKKKPKRLSSDNQESVPINLPSQNIQVDSKDSPTLSSLYELGIEPSAASSLIDTHGDEKINLAMTLLSLESNQPVNPAGWIITILNRYDRHDLMSQIASKQGQGNSKSDSRRRITDSVMDIHNTDW